jgi:hypothetical protein
MVRGGGESTVYWWTIDSPRKFVYAGAAESTAERGAP